MTISSPTLRKVFICNNGKCAESQDAQALHAALTELIQARGLDQFDAPVRVKCLLSGCLDVCKNGPVMIVHPGAVIYHHVDLTALRQIFEQHLMQGEVVEEFVYHRETVNPGG